MSTNDLTIFFERTKFVDFSWPFYVSRLRFVVRRPEQVSRVFAFAETFSNLVSENEERQLP
jgi:hypothetical protein